MSTPKLMSAERLDDYRRVVGDDDVTELLAHIDAQDARLARVEVLLHDATGGSVTDEPNPTTWDAVRFAEHVRKEQVEVVELLATIFGDGFEDLGGAYGDSFDAVKDALAYLDTAAKRWRDRCPVTAEDVEAAGVTWQQFDAWADANGFTSARRPERWHEPRLKIMGRSDIGWVHGETYYGEPWAWPGNRRYRRAQPEIAGFIMKLAGSVLGRPAFDILDEMVTMEVQS